jgi:hypothetical protein
MAIPENAGPVVLDHELHEKVHPGLALLLDTEVRWWGRGVEHMELL